MKLTVFANELVEFKPKGSNGSDLAGGLIKGGLKSSDGIFGSQLTQRNAHHQHCRHSWFLWGNGLRQTGRFQWTDPPARTNKLFLIFKLKLMLHWNSIIQSRSIWTSYFGMNIFFKRITRINLFFKWIFCKDENERIKCFGNGLEKCSGLIRIHTVSLKASACLTLERR